MASILVIEPDHQTRVSFRNFLESSGHYVVSTTNGAEALSFLDRISVPHLIFLSSSSPFMPSQDFLNCLRKNSQYFSVPVVQIKEQNEASLSDICCSIEKPITKESVLDCLAKCLRM